MPQMAPLSWLTLMIVFSLIITIFNIMNFYNSLKLPKTQSTKTSNLKTNWKW